MISLLSHSLAQVFLEEGCKVVVVSLGLGVAVGDLLYLS